MEAPTRDAIKQSKDEDFQAFLQEPMTSLTLSQIPETNPPEALKLLLRAAFDAGVGNGMSQILRPLIENMGKERK